MNKSIKLKQNYWDSSSIMHNKHLLKNVLDKLNNNTIISIDEKIIGTHYNGDILYSKSYVVSIYKNLEYEFNLGFPVKECWIDTANTFFTNSSGYTLTLGHYGGSHDWSRVFINNDLQKVYVQFGDIYLSIDKFAVITIKYTKF